ncbi:CDP-diacylglycerol--serine O-phosphatidyltransferase [Longirhabdus pacifica]|uniref:CDP-diacylglycerol--serine O-phosphatidyltransferase n=1 Tax=Longirhabdus pacifica TaxID=2305227 RepID=UPI00100911CA|nr:CDP-diacylglycerol--serine O-phosphatidyltransferase [Longirhabdus pacifica]
MINKSLPNLFTIGNLCMGMLAILFIFNNKPELAAFMVILAMITDGLDGKIARALNVQSDFGRELDSLSDVISFGVAPAFIMYVVLFQDIQPTIVGLFATAIFPICGAVRLARFNVVESQPGYFIGLPIPAAGAILSTIALFEAEFKPMVLVIITLLLSVLMVSNIKYPNFKNIHISRKHIWLLLLCIVLLLLSFLYFPEQCIMVILAVLCFYALYGLKKKK